MNNKNTRPYSARGFPTAFPRLPVKILGLLVLAVLPWGGALLAADPPALIPFQGHLARPTTSDPNKFEPVPSGQYDILFTIYAAPVGGESKVWGPERHTRVVVVNGLVNVMLGSVIGFADAITGDPNFFARPLYVGITVDADGNPSTADLELVPRQVFLPAVQALNAGKLDGADWQTFFVGTDDAGSFTPGITKARDAVKADSATTAASATVATSVAVGAINTAQLADGSVTAAKIAGGTGVWLADGVDNIYHDVGNVGIGTATPAATLDVNGNATISGNVGIGTSTPVGRLTLGNGKLVVQGDSTIDTTPFTGLGFQYYSDQGEGAIMSSYAPNGFGFLSFYTKAAGSPITQRMVITRDGNVGIGTASPNNRLQVIGGITAASLNGEKPPYVIFVGDPNFTDTQLWHTNNVESSIIESYLGDADGGTVRLFLRRNSDDATHAISERMSIEQPNKVPGKPEGNSAGLYGATLQQNGGGETYFTLGTGAKVQYIPAPYGWAYMRNYPSGGAPGLQPVEGPAWTGSDKYKVQFLTVPNVSATIVIYDRAL